MTDRRLLLKGLLMGQALWFLPNAAQAAETTAEAGRESAIETIKKRGTLRVGLSSFVPWAMRDKAGNLIGFEVDVSTKVAEDMGVKVELVPTAWDGIIPGLIAGKFDAIIGGMSITPSRNLTVNFSAPYAHSGLQMVVSKEQAPGVKSLADLNRPDATIAIRRGVAPAVAVVQRSMPLAQLRQFDDDSQAFQELLNGNATAVISSSPKPEFQTLEHGDALYMPFTETLKANSEAIALRKGDPDAVNFFSNWALYRTQDGWLKERHDYWFTTMDWKDKVAAN